MKNTMKIKSLLSFFVPAAMLSLGVASCSDYDNGYTEGAIKFTEDFRKAFGDIDPEQDWNLAERASVTVSTMKESDVKIYALMGDEYCIVGHYEGVKGTQMLGFDMVEGTKSIMVTDGQTAEQTVPGGVVTFGDTRTVLTNTAGLEVTKLASAVTIGEETYPAYKTVTGVEFEGLIGKNGRVPQAEYNIDKVSCDFTFVSTGSFIIYPIYWYTISQNTLGIYYTDASGYHEVDIYKSRDSQADEIWYASDNTIIDNNEGWSFNHDSKSSVTPKNFGTQTTERNDQKDPSGIVAPFMEFWRGNTDVGIDHIKCSKEFTVSPNEECLVEVAARLRNQKNGNSDNMGTATFTANGNSVVLTDPNNCTKGSYTYDGLTQGNLYSNMNGTGKIWVKCKADSSGKIKVEWDVNTQNAANPANWFSFKDVKITRFNKDINSMAAAGNGVEHFVDNPDHNVVVSMVKGQGIRVDLNEGIRFGMYLKKQQDNETFTFYSESSKNALDSRLTNKISRYGFTCPLNYASTFYVGDQMYLGFEDWPSDYAGGGDFDLNDMIFAFDGCKPTIINEDPEPSSWLLACEDLGATFDIDYNDVVFKIQHISGETKAYLTPLAAGGTLASYIYFEDPIGNNDKVFNEIHQLFGAAPQNSGDYTIINALNSRTEGTCEPIEFTVDKDWTLAFYSSDKYYQSDQYQNVNMGGLEIRTLPKNTPAPNNIPGVNDNIFSGASRIQAPDELGAAPYILCIPASYTRLNMNGYTPQNGKKTEYEWAWPVEFCTITGPYPEFAEWVTNHNTHGDWYKNKSTHGATVEDKYVVSDINGGSNNGGNNGDNKLASDLTLKSNANLILTSGSTQVDLRDYITTSSTGDISYTITAVNNSLVTVTYTMNYNESCTFNFSDGAGYVTITQAADDNYEAGSLNTFTISVSENSGMAYQKSQTTDADGQKDGNYLFYSYAYKYMIEPSAFRSYDSQKGMTLTITASGGGGNNYLYYIGSQLFNSNGYFNPDDNYNNTITISLSAQDVSYAKTYGLKLLGGNWTNMTIAANQ